MLKKQTDMRSCTTNRRMTNKIPIGEGEWIGIEFSFSPVPRVRVFPIMSLLRSDLFSFAYRPAGLKEPYHFLLRSQVSKWALLVTHDLGFLENPAPVS